MKVFLNTAWSFARETIESWVAHKAPRLGAALSYYAVFSVGPLLVILVGVAGSIWGADAVRGELRNELAGLLGPAGGRAVEAMLASAGRAREGWLATVIGLLLLVFGAVGVVAELKDSLNTIWNVAPPKQQSWWTFIRTYVVSAAAVLALGFLLLISLALTTFMTAVGNHIFLGAGATILEVLNFILSFGFVTLLFALMFKFLPDTPVGWGDVWVGAFVTALLFNLGKLLIGLYIGNQGLESTYGAAASVVALLIWIYYSAQMVFLGAEFTRVYARRFGSHRGRQSGLDLPG